MSTKFVLLIRSVAFIGLAVVFGWNTSLWAKGHDQGLDLGSINPGLVRAFHSVGQNLYGPKFFGASVVSVTDVDDMPAVQIDISDSADTDEPTPLTLINVFDSETCETVAQVLVGGGLPLRIIEPDDRDDFYDTFPTPCETETTPGRDR